MGHLSVLQWLQTQGADLLAADPGRLVELGLWERGLPRGLRGMAQGTPRYFAGRSVLVRAAGVCPDAGDPAFMRIVVGEPITCAPSIFTCVLNVPLP